MWVRYRFKTDSEDCRPIIYNPAFPYWISGYDSNDATIIVAWLPDTEKLEDYWDDAYSIDSIEHEIIEFTERFPKPKDFITA